jgi:hypothetical protein
MPLSPQYHRTPSSSRAPDRRSFLAIAGGAEAKTGITFDEIVGPPAVDCDIKVIEDPLLYVMALFDLQKGGRVQAAGVRAKINLRKVPECTCVLESACRPADNRAAAATGSAGRTWLSAHDPGSAGGPKTVGHRDGWHEQWHGVMVTGANGRRARCRSTRC